MSTPARGRRKPAALATTAAATASSSTASPSTSTAPAHTTHSVNSSLNSTTTMTPSSAVAPTVGASKPKEKQGTSRPPPPSPRASQPKSQVKPRPPAPTANSPSRYKSPVIPARRDSSIGATSTNPRVRSASVLEAAAARSPRSHHTPVDFNAADSKAAMKRLRAVMGPVVLKMALRIRRQKSWKGVYPPRRYTADSVVSAITASKSILAGWPHDLLEQLAEEAQFHYLQPKQYIVYCKESHLSSGIVVLLHGQLSEVRQENKSVIAAAERPIHTKRVRTRYASDVMCDTAVLCEDRTSTGLTTREKETADVAVISSRWFWEVFHRYVLNSPLAERLLDSFRDSVIPQRTEMLLASYFPTSVVLQRSWLWPSLSGSDRVKLARSMQVKVLNIGDVLFEEGDRCPYMCIVRRGTLTVVVKGEPLSIVESGTAFGEVSILFNDPRNCTVVAGSMCELYCLHVRELYHRFGKYPALADAITDHAIERRTRWMEDGKVRDIFGLVYLLGGVPCLGHTTDSMREEIARRALVYIVPAGFKVAAAGTPCDTLFVIGRGAVRVGGALDPTQTYRCAPNNGESRSAGDFFGELCLRRHLWPTDVVTETSVDVWALSRDDIISILETNKAEVQAEEVCRQGIALYRAQNGEESIVEGFDAVLPSRRSSGVPSARARGSTAGGSTPSGRRRKSTSPSAALSSLSQTAHSLSAGDEDRTLASLRAFNWVQYIDAKSHEDTLTTRRKSVPVMTDLVRNEAPPRELRQVDKDTEKAMKRKVQELVSVGPQVHPSPADCDFPGLVPELQAIIVEQLLLTPTEEQPRFLRQVNDSNVKLVTEGEEGGEEGAPFTGAEEVGPMEELAAADNFFSMGPINAVGQLDPIQTIEDAENETSVPFGLDEASGNAFGGASLFGAGIHGSDTFSMENSAAMNTWTSPFTRSRRSIAVDDGVMGGLATLGQQRGSVSRSYLVRPPSGLPGMPRGSVTELISPRGLRPTSSSEQQISGVATTPSGQAPGSSSGVTAATGPRLRPTSVDFSQQVKVGAERSSSVLDRFVKIEDQDYFNAFVQVLPLEQDEIWLPGDEPAAGSNGGEGGSGNASGTAGLILLLMHVRQCQYLEPELLADCAAPIVKVTVGQRVLVRTPVMTDHVSPAWSVEESSFISFLHRGLDVRFVVCDAEDEAKVMYECTLSTASILENGGVGQQVIKLSRPHDTSMETTLEASKPAHAPRVAATMLAVTASKYKALQRHLDNGGSEGKGGLSLRDSNTVYMQVLAVCDMKHRVEASVVVSLEEDGVLRTLLETPRVLPKTRFPAWSAEKAFVKVQSDGFLHFALHHKDNAIGAYGVSVDDLAFGGEGIRHLPLALTRTGGEVIGDLLVEVLATLTSADYEDKRQRKVLFLHIEEVALDHEEAYDIPPDPFVIVRSAAGEVVMRTPLALGTCHANWAANEASAFLSCPILTGSTATYELEVCDNDETVVMGKATMPVTSEGIGPSQRYDVPLQPSGKGRVRVRVLCFPIHEVSVDTKSKRKSIAPAAPHYAAHLLKNEPVVLVHMVGCSGLPGCESGQDDLLRTDAVATLSFAAEELVRTPTLQTDAAATTWTLARTSTVIRVPGLAGSGPVDTSSATAVITVYDGVVDESDEVGEVRVGLGELCRTGRYTYNLRPRPGTAAFGSDRKLGMVELETFCGRLDAQVLLPGESPAFGLAADSSDLLYPIARSAVHDVALGDGTAAASHSSGSGAVGVPRDERQFVASLTSASGATQPGQQYARQVKLALTVLCNAIPAALAKTLHVTLTSGGLSLLKAEQRDVTVPNVEWDVTESFVVLDLANMGGKNIQVKVTATDVVYQSGLPPTPDADAALAATQRQEDSANRVKREERVLVGLAEIPFTVVAAVPVDEVKVFTATLASAAKPNDPSGRGGSSHSGRPPTASKAGTGDGAGAKVAVESTATSLSVSLVGVEMPPPAGGDKGPVVMRGS